MRGNSFTEWRGDVDPYSAYGAFSLSSAAEAVGAMSYLRDKYENENERRSAREPAFSSYEGAMKNRSCMELLARVFLWIMGRSHLHGESQF